MKYLYQLFLFFSLTATSQDLTKEQAIILINEIAAATSGYDLLEGNENQLIISDINFSFDPKKKRYFMTYTLKSDERNGITIMCQENISLANVKKIGYSNKHGEVDFLKVHIKHHTINRCGSTKQKGRKFFVIPFINTEGNYTKLSQLIMYLASLEQAEKK